MTSAFSLHLREISPLTKKPTIATATRKEGESLTRMRRRGRTRGAARRPLRRYTQSTPEDQHRRAPAGRSASSISLVRVSQKEWNAEGRRVHTLTHLCMSPGTDLHRSLHDLDLRRVLHAPQLPNERREWPPLRRGNDVHIRCDFPLPLLLLLDLGRRPTTRGACARSNTRGAQFPRTTQCAVDDGGNGDVHGGGEDGGSHVW
jgi:hypothetical protein